MTAASDRLHSALDILRAFECGAANCECHRNVQRGSGLTHCPSHHDPGPSLNVTPTKDGNVLLKCHGGCEQADVIETLREKDLWDRPAASISRLPKITARYVYTDEAGQPLYQIVKLTDPKRFQAWAFAGWNADKSPRFSFRRGGLATIRRVPYRLRELIESRDEIVVVCEGEKDTDNVRDKLGLTAITNPFGGGKWPAGWAETYLRGRKVIVCGDNDRDGEKQNLAVARDCAEAKVSCVALRLPNLPHGGDVSDWINAGGTRAALLALASATPPPLLTEDKPHDVFRWTEGGMADRFLRRHGEKVRYVATWDQWLLWDGRRWKRDDVKGVRELAKETLLSMLGDTPASLTEAKKLQDWVKGNARDAKMTGMLAWASSDPRAAMRAEDFDKDPMLLNCLNGTLDLRSGELRPQDQADLITKLAPVTYDGDAESELWDRFMATAIDSGELRGFIQRAVGYSLTGETGEEVMFFVHGPAAAGKSTFVEAIKSALGEYAMTADFDAFLSRASVGSPRNDIARMNGARMVASIEVDEGKRLAEGVVKMLTGGDTIAVRHLYKEFFEFRPHFKIWLAANHAPKVSDEDEALWRRILRIPFRHVIPKAERSADVKRSLTDPTKHGPAILAWAVRGALAWQKQGLGVPALVEDATEEYREEMSPVTVFIEERCVMESFRYAKTDELYAAYVEWSRTSGERRQITKVDFGRRLSRIDGLRNVRGVGGVRQWLGIGLASQDTLQTAESEMEIAAADLWKDPR